MIKRMQLIDAMLQYAGVEHTSFDMDDIYYMYNADLYIYIYIYIYIKLKQGNINKLKISKNKSS